MNRNEKNLVFCYGSIKRGFGNNSFVADQEFLGSAKSASKEFVMVSLGAFPAVCKHEDGMKVSGEVYRVDAPTMRSLDLLEGNGNLYTRTEEDFILSDGTVVKAWIYLMHINVAKHLYSKNNYRTHSVVNDGDSLLWL